MKIGEAIALRQLTKKGFNAYITPNGNLKGSRIGVIKGASGTGYSTTLFEKIGGFIVEKESKKAVDYVR